LFSFYTLLLIRNKPSGFFATSLKLSDHNLAHNWSTEPRTNHSRGADDQWTGLR